MRSKPVGRRGVEPLTRKVLVNGPKSTSGLERHFGPVDKAFTCQRVRKRVSKRTWPLGGGAGIRVLLVGLGAPEEVTGSGTGTLANPVSRL